MVCDILCDFASCDLLCFALNIACAAHSSVSHHVAYFVFFAADVACAALGRDFSLCDLLCDLPRVAYQVLP